MTSSDRAPIRTSLPRRRVLAWAMYDWANSSYSTLSITVLVAYLEKIVFPPDRYGNLGAQVWAFGISISMLIAALLSPLVGAMADRSGTKRWWLAATAGLGAGSAIAISLVSPEAPWVIVGLFVAACLMFELSLGVYNGFLPEIADDDAMNRVSSWGYGLGYVGGGLALILALVLMRAGPEWGIDSPATQMRVGVAVMGAWWGIFSLPTILLLKDHGVPSPRPASSMETLRRAFGDVASTLRNLRSYRALAWFLLGFLFYNDGIQTVISQSSTFALQELSFTTDQLIGLILMVQFIAMPGAIAVGWLSDRCGEKPVLLASLVIWMALLITAFFITTKTQFWLLAVVLGLVLGGTQSVSRTIMGKMTPRRHAAEFFGFFNFSGKATSFLGTFSFGMILRQTHSARYAVVGLLAFFVIGTLLVAWVRVERRHVSNAGE